jgi:hypothetical protein
MRLYTISSKKISKYRKYPPKKWYSGWHEGISDREMNFMKKILKRRFELGYVRYWKEGDSYIIPTILGNYCISRDYFNKKIYGI